jgi:hypothetical protein
VTVASEDDEGGEAAYSLDYVSDIVSALKEAKVDDVTIRWDAEMPIYFEFRRTEDETVLYDGEFMIAPRVSSE